MQKNYYIAALILLFSVSSLASFGIGFRAVLSGGFLPTLVVRYEHPAGHGLELTCGIMPRSDIKYLLRGEIGYTYRYQGIAFGVGRGITRYGKNSLPSFDDHLKLSLTKKLTKQQALELGGTLSLGTKGQGLAMWGGINRSILY